MKTILFKIKNSSKSFLKQKTQVSCVILLGILNLIYWTIIVKCSKKVEDFLTVIYKFGMIPIISKPEWITWKTVTAIDCFLTNLFVNTFFFPKLLFSKQIFLTIFLFVFLFPLHEIPNVHRTTCLHKRNINAESIEICN